MVPQVLVAPDERVPHPGAEKRPPDRQPQIQALRAIAVISVIVFHFWPQLLTGGYVGVDVFFVISGYLMTKSILHIRDDQGRRLRLTMREFYSRRVARILPAALLTLLACTVITLVALPVATWTENFTQILSSAFFVENWTLAASATDYLGSTTGSVVQHFWSLSVEEQFYAVWPLVVWFAAKAAPSLTARGRFVRLLACFGALTAVSFVFSVQETAANSSVAYFHTGTRFWELSLGGLAFVCDRYFRGHWTARAVSGWVGLALIAFALLTFDDSTLFPSWRALIPVAGAALVILSAPDSARWGPARLLSARPAQVTGDISYSMYLVHWPLLILAGARVTDGTPSDLTKLTLFVLVFPLAWTMKKQVEDRFRRSTSSVPAHPAKQGTTRVRAGRVPLRRTLLVMATAQTLVIAVSLGGLLHYRALTQGVEVSAAAFSTSEAAQAACYAAISAGKPSASCPQPTASVLSVVPNPLVAVNDWPYARCQEAASTTTSTGRRCDLATGSAGRVVIAGDSHITMWIPAILPWAAKHHYSVTTFLRSGCPLTDIASGVCGDWNQKVLAEITALKPQFVLTSARSAVHADNNDVGIQGLARRWQALSDLGSKIIAFRDIPQPDNAGVGSMPGCLTTKWSFAACEFDKQTALSHDVVPSAARLVTGAQTIDLSAMFCPTARCKPEINGILVWIDGGHMSSYFARGLANALTIKLDRATGSH